MTQSTDTKKKKKKRETDRQILRVRKFLQECQQFAVTPFPHAPMVDNRFLNRLRHQRRCYENRQLGEVFFTISLSR